MTARSAAGLEPGPFGPNDLSGLSTPRPDGRPEPELPTAASSSRCGTPPGGPQLPAATLELKEDDLADIAAAVHATGAGTGPTSPPSFCGPSPPMSRIGITRRGSRWRGGRAAAHGAAEDQLGAARGAAEDRLDVGSG